MISDRGIGCFSLPPQSGGLTQYFPAERLFKASSECELRPAAPEETRHSSVRPVSIISLLQRERTPEQELALRQARRLAIEQCPKRYSISAASACPALPAK